MRLFLSVFLLPGLVCPSTGAQESQAPSTIKIETDLVTLTATVLDRGDRPIVDLEKSDFLLYEDGVAQDIAVFQKEDVPVSLGILFDTSGSMVDKIDEVKDAVIHLINTTNAADDIFVMQFSTEAFVVQNFTGDRQALAATIGTLRARGSTALYEAILKGSEYVQHGQHKKRALIVITDGNDTSSEISLEQALDTAVGTEVLIYCLGIGHGEHGSFGHLEGLFKGTVDIDVLRRFSNLTGGRALLVEGPHFKHGVDQIDQACQSLSAELRRQYALGYYPHNKTHDGKYRRIRVEVRKEKLKVRARDSYFAPRG